MGKLLGQLSGVFIPLAALSLTVFIKTILNHNGIMLYSSSKVCHILVVCCFLHNLVLEFI